MRERQALSRREVSVPIGLVLVSRSDLNGRFVEVSHDLERFSGYDADALIGEYDEVLLHPEVPRGVIEDMRRDLAADRPWCGILEYRCRNGDHYWARVDIAPIRERGNCVGFVSIFRRAMRHQVERAEEAYRRLRERRADGFVIRHGGVAAAGAIARALRRYADLPARFKLTSGVLLATGSGMVLGAVTVGLADGASEGLAAAGALGAAGLLGLFLGAGICVATAWDASRRLHDARRVMEALAAGEYLSHVECRRDDEAGRLQQDLKILQTRLAADVMCRESADSVAVIEGRGAATASVRGAIDAMRSDVAALVAQAEQHVGAVDQALEIVRSARDVLGAEASRGDTAIAAPNDQSRERIELAVARLAGNIDRIRAGLSRGEDAVNRLDLLAFRTRLLALNAVLEQARHSDGTPTTALLVESRDVVRGVSESACDIRDLLTDSADGVESGAVFLRDIEGQLGTLMRRRRERSVSTTGEVGGFSDAAALLDRLLPELQQIGMALRNSADVSGRLLASLSELEQATDSLEQGAAAASADGNLHRFEENAHPPLRSRRRTATISPLRPVRHDVGTPVPKIGRAGASKGVPDDGWEEFHE